MAFDSYKKITLDDMIDYIEEKGTKEDKKAFKAAAFSNKKGEKVDKYNHLSAVRWFCGKYMPELLPTKKEKEPNKSDRIKNW